VRGPEQALEQELAQEPVPVPEPVLEQELAPRRAPEQPPCRSLMTNLHWHQLLGRELPPLEPQGLAQPSLRA
jgi:hypothetical protein